MVELPEQDELVIAVIKKILPYGAFCELPEYGKFEAFLHISEVAPRWIKNIHEFISEGQQHVARVYHIDREKNQVDLSLKRVSEEEKKRKLEFIQNEKRASKLIQLSLDGIKSDLKPDEIRTILEDKFGDLYSVFKEVCEHGEEILQDVKLPAAVKSKIVEISQRNIKKQIVKVGGTVIIQCFGQDGIEKIKNALKTPNQNVEIHYLGAPRYQLTLTASTYKEAEKAMNEVVEKIKTFAQKNSCEFSFERI